MSGPYADAIGMNADVNLFGPGSRPNATIGTPRLAYRSLIRASRLSRSRLPKDLAAISARALRTCCSGVAAAPASDNVRVRQGSVEEPNVDPLIGMVDLIAIQRAYAAFADLAAVRDSAAWLSAFAQAWASAATAPSA